MRSPLLVCLLLLAALAPAQIKIATHAERSAVNTLVTGPQAEARQDSAINALRWRLVGPFRGGRSVAVAGSQARKDEYYFGATGGGLWKTTDSGQNWENVSDGFFGTSSVGAIAVSPSNPDIVYVGMGERSIRGNISYGDGMYKSTDAGKTWTHIGLRDSQMIARVRVHPTNPDIVYVAALGHIFGPNEERGVFKSTDGGATWSRILFESNRAGAVDLSMDAKNPDVLYAATWEAWRTPYTLNSGGPGSKLWKTTDAGKTWTDLSRNPGMPTGTLGKIGVSVSPADPNRVYALVEALEGGLFVSDDAGATWRLVNDNRNFRQRAWYYTYVHAGPTDKDQVYVLNVGFHRSNDGGKTFTGISVPHVDNHDLWIAPDDPQRMINSNDGGANVSTNGGRTWSHQNYPTAQFYHVTTDNHFPYRIYGAQQDNSTVRIASRTQGGGITSRDWEGTAGGESGYLAPKPDDPEIVFGGSYGGYLQMLNHRTRQSRNVSVWPDNPMGHGAESLTHRIQWTFPIVFSPHDPNTIYTTSQHLFKTTNMGETWKIISPDLTRNDRRTMGPSGGPITKDNTSVEYYGTIFTVAESPLRPGLIWCGSDDGLIHVSSDAGGSWQNVTPPQLPGRDLQWPMISLIEASPHSPAVAYAAVTNYKNNDHTPYIYRTSDFGRSWTLITNGIPVGAYVRAVREDPVRAGLLYAGTETGVYVSFDNGSSWRPLQLNLPNSPIHNLVVKEDDLVVATHGRSFWVLDDITPLREAWLVREDQPYLFQPRDSYRVNWGGGGRRSGAGSEPSGDNPPSGITVSYFLPQEVEGLRFEFVDPSGEVVATRDGAKTAGTHRFSTNLQYPGFRSFPGMIMWAAGSRPIPAPPGLYTVRMRSGDQILHSRQVRLLPDPRSEATEADLIAQAEFARRISERVNDANDAVVLIREVKRQVDERIASDPQVRREGEALKDRLSAIEEEIYQVRNRSGQDPLNFPIKLNNRIAALLGVVLSGNYRPTDQSYEVFAQLSQELQVQLDRLEGVWLHDLRGFNALLERRKLQPVTPQVRATPPASSTRGGDETGAA
jgi:photosystem II stability/assembly factor-like uncharacterized protein